MSSLWDNVRDWWSVNRERAGKAVKDWFDNLFNADDCEPDVPDVPNTPDKPDGGTPDSDESFSPCSCKGKPCKGTLAHKDKQEGGVTLPGCRDVRIGADSDQVGGKSPFGRPVDRWMPVTRALMKAGALTGSVEDGLIVLRGTCVTLDGIRYHGLGFTFDSSSDPLITPESRPDICSRQGDVVTVKTPKVGRTVRYETVRITP